MGNAFAKMLCVLCCFAVAGSVLLPYLTLDDSEMEILNAKTNAYRLADENVFGGGVLVVAAAGTFEMSATHAKTPIREGYRIEGDTLYTMDLELGIEEAYTRKK